MTRLIDRAVALLAAVVVHGAFVAAVGSMALALATGLQLGQGTATGAAAVALDVALVLQFPVVHSLLLRASGRRLLAAVLPGRRGQTLQVSTYVLVASCQLLATFWLWSPSGVVWYSAHGVGATLHYPLFIGAWAFLVKALSDAGLGVQTGAAGWLALWQGGRVDYGSMPTRGLFQACRQPIYLGFSLVLWTAPTWSPDLLLLAAGWSVYCLLGPLHKEARWSRLHGQAFLNYQRGVPYFLPRFRR